MLRLGDTYRASAALRILLGNLFDYPVAEGRASALDAMKPVPILNRPLDSIGRSCHRRMPERVCAFEFHKVYHSINHFCAVDLSSPHRHHQGPDVCDAPDSPRRRAAIRDA